MARLEDIAFKLPDDHAISTKTDNTAASASRSAPGAHKRIYVTGVEISASEAPAAAVTAELLTASTVLKRWVIPANAIAPIVIEFKRPVACGINEAASLTCEAIGASKTLSVTLSSFVAGE